MLRLFRTCLVLSLAAGAAWAQDQSPSGDGIPLGREKDRVRMTPRTPAGAEQGGKAAEGGPGKPPEEPKDAFSENLGKLAKWPATEAREAVAVLCLLGPEVEKRLLPLLPTSEPAMAAGIAMVLGEVGGDESLAAVQRLAGAPGMTPFLPVLFDVLGRLDGENAVKRVLPFLRHPKRPARESAEVWLSGRLNASHAPRLEDLLDDPARGVRLSGLRLLRRVMPERGVEKAFEHLGDEAPEVARLAAEILSTETDATVLGKLLAICGAADARRAAYAILALVYVEQATGVRPWTEASSKHLLGGNGLRSAEKLNRGIASVALADIGFDSQDPAIDGVLDQTVVPILLDSFAGPTVYKDYASVADLARDRFGKLTGLYERVPVSELWAWWQKNQESFSARRALREIPADRLDTLRVRARSLVEPALPTTLFSAVAADAGGPDVSGIDFVYLLPGDAQALAAVLSRDFLVLRGTAAFAGSKEDDDRGAAFGPEVEVTLSVGGRSRSVAVRSGAVPPELSRILAALIELRERYAWQRFWDRAVYPDYAAFIRAESGFFAASPEPAARAEKMKDLILTAFDDLATAAERLDAVRILAGLPVEFSDRDAYRLALTLDSEEELTPFAEKLCEVLARTGRPLILPILGGFLEKHPGGRSLDHFAAALARFGTDEILRSAGSERFFYRRAAMRAAPDGVPPSGLAAVLARGARDENPLVRREAYLSFGRSRLDEALPALDAGTSDPDVEASTAAIRGLGELRRPEAVPILLRQLASEDAARRIVAVEALCASRLGDSLPAVLRTLGDDPSPLVQSVAARDVALFGELALRGLTGILMDPARGPGSRVLALEATARIGRDMVFELLSALLADTVPEVADAAAFALAARARKVAVPQLLSAVEAGRNPAMSLAALELVSLQTFPSARSEELPAIYRGWWSEHRSEPESAWLADALRERGAPEEPLRSLSAGDPVAAAIPALLSGLSDDRWFVRATSNLWLSRLTGEDFGEITRSTSAEETRAVEMRWRALLEAR
jgi:HEAT repeat protein